MSSADSLISQGGRLYLLLGRKFPAHRSTQGLQDIPKLAKDCQLSHETRYRAVRGKKRESFSHVKLTVPVAVALLKTSKPMAGKKRSARLYIEEVVPFVIPNFDDHSDPMRPLRLI